MIFALLSLLLASFGLYRDLGVPLAVGIGVMLLTGLTLLPALLAILGRAAFWPSAVTPGTRREGWSTGVARRLLRRPGMTLGLGLLIFACFASAALSYRSGGFGGATNAPAGSDAAAGDASLLKNFPKPRRTRPNIVMRSQPADLDHPADSPRRRRRCRSSAGLRETRRPAQPHGFRDPGRRLREAARRPRQPGAAPTTEPSKYVAEKIPLFAYEIYHAHSGFVFADGRTIMYQVSLKVGNPDSNAAINSVPRLREIVAAAADGGARRAEQCRR